MRRILRLSTWPLVLAALLLLSRTHAAGTPPPKDESPRADCAFSNPGFSGWCRQTVPVATGQTPKQACEAVLSCLNDNACASNYCNAPNVRGGWRLEEAKTSQPTPKR
jgi:hypothetical protein